MMTVFKNTALKVKAFAMSNFKSALLSFTVLSLSSCATDPKVLEQESKEAQALSATDFTKNLEHKMFFYNLEMLTDTDDSHVHIYRTRGIYDVSYNYPGSKYRMFCNLKGGELHYQFCVDEKVNKPIFFVSFTNHRAKTDGFEVNSEMTYLTDTALLGERNYFFETHVYEPSKGVAVDDEKWLEFAKKKGFKF